MANAVRDPMHCLLLMAVLAAPQFEVQTLAGKSASGIIVALDEKHLTLETQEGKQSLPVDELLMASSGAAPTTTPSQPTSVELSDGSRIAATELQTAGNEAQITDSNGAKIELPIKALAHVRFIDAATKSDKVDAQWRQFAESHPAGDLLVVRKDGALDSVEGVVGDITAQTVAFTLDGDKIDVKREKIEGIVFANPTGRDPAEGRCVITNRTGSRFVAASLRLTDGTLEITTPAGLKTSLKLEDAARLDFSAGKLVFLSDLEPESFEFQPYFGPAQRLPSLAAMYRLRQDRGLENNPLKLDGRTFSKGLALHSRSVVSYRLPGKFRTFKALAGIDDIARDAGGDVLLEIKGDGKSLWKGSIRGDQPAQALELEISGVKRLEIVADFGEGQDVADHLNLCDARVTK